jgi:hypothetical protein
MRNNFFSGHSFKLRAMAAERLYISPLTLAN